MGKIFKQDEDEAWGKGVKKCAICGETMPYGISDHIANNIDCQDLYINKNDTKESSNPEKVSKEDLEKEAEAKSETGQEKNTDTTTKLFEILQSAPKDNPSLGAEKDSESESYMNEEEIYELISDEIGNGNTKKGLWTKAFSEAEGDENKAKAVYIKYRFDQMNDVQPQVEEKKAVTNENCFFCEKPNSNLLMIIGENKENFCSPKCYSRALIRKDSEKIVYGKSNDSGETGENVIKFSGHSWPEKFLNGDFGLAKTYWLFYFIPNGLLNFLTRKVPNEQFYLIYGLFSIYLLPVMLGIWRAADRYEGSKIWSFLAKFTVILGIIILIIGIIIFFNLVPK